MRRAKDAGAAFAFSPGFDPKLVECANELGFAYMPAVATPSEMMQAQSFKLKELKFFPAQAMGGLAMLRSMVSPFSELDFCPTGGIKLDNMSDYLALKNVFCVGGSWIATSDDMLSRNWQGIIDKAKLARLRVENE